MKNLHSFVAQKCGKNLLLIKYRRRRLRRGTNDSRGISEPHVKRANFISLPFSSCVSFEKKDSRARREREKKIVRHVSYTYIHKKKRLPQLLVEETARRKKISLELSLVRNVGVSRSVAVHSSVIWFMSFFYYKKKLISLT